MTAIDVFIAPAPFTPRVERREALPGASLAEMLTRAVREEIVALADVPRAVFYVNGLAMPRATPEERRETLDFVPPDGAVVNIAVEPAGGGGGDGNKALQVVLQIAVLALSFAVPGMQFLAGAAPWVRTAVAAAVAVGGQAAIAAAFAPTTPSQKDAADRRALQDQSNQLRQRQPMPLILGKQRFAFDVAAKPYTQLVGEDVWLHVIFGVHYGKCQVEDIKIGETKLSDYPGADIRIEQHLVPGPRTFNLYPSRVVQENLSDQIEIGGDWEVHTTAIETERVELDFTWPGGLRFNKDNGKTLKQQVQLQVQVAAVGSDVWTPAPFPGVNEQDATPLGNGFYRIHARSNEALRRTIGWALPVKGQIKIRVRATEPDGDERSRSVDATYWTALRSMEAQTPIVDQTLSVIEMKIRSSDDLNGALPVVSGVVTPIVPIYSGGNWATEAPTSNSAALARWLLMGPPAARPLPSARIAFEAAYEAIEEHEWGAGLAITSEASQEDALLALGRAGRFSAFYDGATFQAVPDWEKPVARQLFTQRNAQGLRYRRSFIRPLHAVLVEFRNRDEDDRPDELYVYADGYTSENATLIESLELPMSVTGARAFKEGRVYLAKRELQVERFEWSAEADTIATTYGDRVLVSHPSTLFGEAEARVQNRIWQGGLVAGIRLDGPVRMVEGETYAIDVRRPDGILKGLEVVTAPGLQRALMFPMPLTAANAPGKGDLLAFGRTELITEDVDIVDFEPQSDGTVSIQAQRYMGPEILAAETGEIPELQTKLQALAKAPEPRFLGPAIGSPAGVTAAYDVDPIFDHLAGFRARWRLTPDDPESEAGWATLPPLGPNARVVRTPPIDGAQTGLADAEGEYRVDLEIRSVLRNGDVSAPARLLGALVTRGAPPVEEFTAEAVVRTAPDGSSYGAIAISAKALVAGDVQDLVIEIRERPVTGAPGQWKAASGGTLPAANPVGDVIEVKAGQAYGVHAGWRTADNWPGAWSQEVVVTIPAGADVAGDVVSVGGKPRADLIDQLDHAFGGSIATAAAMIRRSLDNWAEKQRLNALTLLDGVPVGTVLLQEIEDRTEAVLAILQTLSLLGAKSGDGLSWILDLAKVMVDEEESLGQRLTTISAVMGDGSITLAELAEVSADINGRLEGVLGFLFDVDGRISGMQILTQGGSADPITVIKFLADVVAFYDPDSDTDRPFFQVTADGLILGNNFIGTPSVIDNAITDTVSVQETSTTTQVNSVSFGKKILELTRNTNGGDVKLDFSAAWLIRQQQELYFYVFVDSDYNWTGSAESNHLYELAVETSSTGDIQNVTTFQHLITGLAAGAHTFRVYIRNTTGATVDIGTRTLTTQELKK